MIRVLPPRACLVIWSTAAHSDNKSSSVPDSVHADLSNQTNDIGYLDFFHAALSKKEMETIHYIFIASAHIFSYLEEHSLHYAIY